jgi:hypothetical protein
MPILFLLLRTHASGLNTGVITQKWFNYYEEIPIKEKFKITNESSDFETTHFHRPLNMYVKELKKAGFVIEELREPFPDWTKYNVEHSAYNYAYPRFLAFCCRRSSICV